MLTSSLRILALAALAAPFRPLAAPSVQETAATEERNVAIVIYPDVELLDFAGPAEAFASTHTGHGHAFRVYTVGRTREPVASLGLVRLTPEYTFDDCPRPDIVVLPGGHVPLEDESLRNWVIACSRDAELMMSVCNGALVYGRAGLLDGLEATSHKSALQSLALISPTTKVLTNRRFVDNGRVMTCAGISAGIDGALHVVARLYGEETAWATASYMEYDWRPDEIAELHEQPGRLVEGADALRWISALRAKGLEAALAEYESADPRPTETELNRWGYTFLNSSKPEEAVDVLRLAAAAFPLSANAADSLSEACEAQGDTEAAKKHAQECLARLPKDAGLDEARRQVLRNASASRFARLSGSPASALRYVCPPCNDDCDRVGYLEGGRCPGCPMQLVERSQ